jgi:hypothetical protein
VTSTLYAELRSPRVHPVYPARLTRRARSVPARTSASLRPRALLVRPPTFSLRTSASSALSSAFSALATRHFCLTPLFVALPYVSAAGPLYTAFTWGCDPSANSAPPRYLSFSAHFRSHLSAISLTFNSLPPLAPLFAAFSPLVSFVFSSLQTLFADQGGATHRFPFILLCVQGGGAACN